MGAINLPENWALLYDSGVLSRSATPVNGYFKVPDFQSPTIAVEKLISVTVESELARSNWRYAGRLSARIPIPGIEPDLSTILQVELKNLNSYPVLIQVPDLGSDYLIYLEFPFWLDGLTVRIWEYNGPPTALPVYVP